MELILSGLQDSYVELVDYVVKHGDDVTVRGHETKELTGVTLRFESALLPMLPIGVNRKPNLKLAAVEALQLVAGRSRPDLVLKATPAFSDVLVTPSVDEMDYGAYGPRLFHQLADVVQLLDADPSTRQAVVHIWRAEDLTHHGDRPCTVFLQFLVRNDRLELHTHMRSNDVWLGTPYDVFAFTQLQWTVARALGLLPGTYVHHATSLHLYERNFDAAAQLRPRVEEAGDVTRSLPAGVQDFTDVIDPPVEPIVAWRMLRTHANQILTGQRFPEDRNDWYLTQIGKLL